MVARAWQGWEPGGGPIDQRRRVGPDSAMPPTRARPVRLTGRYKLILGSCPRRLGGEGGTIARPSMYACAPAVRAD